MRNVRILCRGFQVEQENVKIDDIYSHNIIIKHGFASIISSEYMHIPL